MAKAKRKICFLPLPSRSLFYVKIVQGERNGKSKAQDLLLALPSRSLAYPGIGKRE